MRHMRHICPITPMSNSTPKTAITAHAGMKTFRNGISSVIRAAELSRTLRCARMHGDSPVGLSGNLGRICNGT